MNNEMNAGDVLLCKLDGSRLEVTAFSHNGETVARRLHLEWNGCVFEVPFGHEVFENEHDAEKCVRDKLIPFLKGLLDSLTTALSFENIGVMIVPMSMQGEIIRNTGSTFFSRPMGQ